MDLNFNTPIYNNYTDTNTNGLVAIERNESKAIGKAFKKHKKAEAIPSNLTVKGYAFIIDEEYQSLKIDFSKELEFKIKDLEKADIS